MCVFKIGVFEIVLKLKVLIYLIVLTGTADALSKRGFVLQGCYFIEVWVFDRIPYERFQHMSVDELTVYIREVIADELDEKQLEPTS